MWHWTNGCTFLKLASTTRRGWLSSWGVAQTINIADEFVAMKELSCSRKSGKTIQFAGARYYLQYKQWKNQSHETRLAWHNC